MTNLTLLIGLPALLWGMNVLPGAKSSGEQRHQEHRINRLSLLLTLTAVLFFTGAVWRWDAKARSIPAMAWSWWGFFSSGSAIRG